MYVFQFSIFHFKNEHVFGVDEIFKKAGNVVRITVGGAGLRVHVKKWTMVHTTMKPTKKTYLSCQQQLLSNICQNISKFGALRPLLQKYILTNIR